MYYGCTWAPIIKWQYEFHNKGTNYIWFNVSWKYTINVIARFIIKCQLFFGDHWGMEEFYCIMGFIQMHFNLSKKIKVNIFKGTIISKEKKIPLCMAWCLTHDSNSKNMNTLKFPRNNYVFGPFFTLKSFLTLKFF